MKWFELCGVNELKLQYYALKSSQQNLITIFPVAKIEKDKSKSAEEIKRFLAEIKLPSKYSINLEHGISTIHLEKEVIRCRLVNTENFSALQSQLAGF
jgi:hypothetical protein